MQRSYLEPEEVRTKFGRDYTGKYKEPVNQLTFNP